MNVVMTYVLRTHGLNETYRYRGFTTINLHIVIISGIRWDFVRTANIRRQSKKSQNVRDEINNIRSTHVTVLGAIISHQPKIDAKTM